MPSKTRNRFDLIRFLDQCDAEIPVVEGEEIVAMADNLWTRGTKKSRWLEGPTRAGASSSPRRMPAGSTR